MLGLILLAGLALPQPQIAPMPPVPTLADIVAGAEVCATREMREDEMLARIAAKGWSRTGGLRQDFGSLTTHSRNGVSLTYFDSKEMKQCIVRGKPATGFDVNELVGLLSAQLGRKPKVEPEGARYLFFLPRSDILTLMVLTEFGSRSVELSVVQ